MGIRFLLFFLKVKFSSCVTNRGQGARGERPCDSAPDCQVIFSRLFWSWNSAWIPQISQKSKDDCVYARVILVHTGGGKCLSSAVLCRKIIFVPLPTLNVRTKAYTVSRQQCSSLDSSSGLHRVDLAIKYNVGVYNFFRVLTLEVSNLASKCNS